MTISPRIKAIFFFLLTLGVVSATILWMFLGERGWLVIEGDLPDRVSGIPQEAFACQETPCKITLVSRDYDAVFEKAGFLPIEQRVTINLLQETSLDLHFVKERNVEVLGKAKTQFIPLNRTETGYKDNRQDTHISILLKDLPVLEKINTPNISELVFSKDGSAAFVKSANTWALNYQEERFGDLAQDEELLMAPSFDEANNAYYFLKKDPNQWDIYRFEPSGQKIRLGSFYGLDNPRIFADKENLVIADRKNNFLYNLQNYSKTEILADYRVEEIKFGYSGRILLKAMRRGIPVIGLFTPKDNKVIELQSFPVYEQVFFGLNDNLFSARLTDDKELRIETLTETGAIGKSQTVKIEDSFDQGNPQKNIMKAEMEGEDIVILVSDGTILRLKNFSNAGA